MQGAAARAFLAGLVLCATLAAAAAADGPEKAGAVGAAVSVSSPGSAAPATPTSAPVAPAAAATSAGSVSAVPGVQPFTTSAANLPVTLSVPQSHPAEDATLLIAGATVLPAGVTATWWDLDRDVAIATGQPVSVPLRPGRPVRLQLRLANFAIGQSYAAEVTLRGSQGLVAILPVGAQRGGSPLPADALKSPSAPLQMEVGETPKEVSLPLQHSGPWPAVVTGPDTVEVVAARNNVSTLSSARIQGSYIQCGADRGGPGKAVVVPPGKTCQVRFVLPLSDPGLYTAKVSVTDQDGRFVAGQATVQVRASALCAIALALLGTLLGWAFKLWTEKARPRLLALEQLADLEAGWSSIGAAADRLGLGWVTRPMGRRLADVRRQVQAGATSPSPTIEALAMRLQRLDRWIALEEEAAGPPRLAGIEASAKPLRKLLANVGADIAASDEAIVKAIEAFERAIDAARAKAAGGAELAPDRRPSDLAFQPFTPRKLRWFGDLVGGLLGMFVIVVTTYLAVWQPNPAWGSVADMLTLLVGSIAAQAGALGVSDAFRSRFVRAG